MAIDTEPNASVDTDAPTEAMFSTVDIILLVLLAVAAIYYLMSRRKKEETTHIRRLTAVPTNTTVAEDHGFIAKMKHGKRNVIVFYGSQTGTAEEFATRLSKEASMYSLKGMVADPEESDMEDLSKLKDLGKTLAIFCVATYGEGDPTDNAQEFYDWLQAGDADLEGMNYAVFGLGNKTYEHFNSMGQYVDKRLEELGARRIFELGVGDDDANIEEDFVSWKEKFWPEVCEEFDVKLSEENINMRQYTLSVIEDPQNDKIFTGEVARYKSFENQKPPYDAKNPYLARVSVNRELHRGGDRSCIHIELDITGSRIRYEAGDHVAVFPVNDYNLVNEIGKLCNTDLDTVFTLTNIDEEASKKYPFPCPCTYRTALSHYIDITSHPRTHVLKELAGYAESDDDKSFLIKLASNTDEGKALYSDWILKDNRTIVCVLQDLPSVKAPLDHICELLPRLQSRYYSISSSPKLHPTTIHVTAMMVDYVTPTGRARKGVATSWLKAKRPDDGADHRVPIFVRRSQFRLPFKPATPVIMVGPGTGIAPFRGFIQERHLVKQEGKPVGETILYTGFRYRNIDFLYEEEFQNYKNEGSLTELNVAISRETETKVYVQHLISQKQAELWSLLENGAHFYVCGDARHMARDVHSILQDVIRVQGQKSEDEVQKYIKKMQLKGRYSCDVWS